MIAHLKGTILEKHPNQVVLDAGGVGYDVQIPVSTYTALPDAGAVFALRIHTHVREDAIQLFGFATSEEKVVFERLIGVSGIGPKLAVTVLSGLATPELITAIRTGDVQRLVRIPGVGKKTAERIGLELKDKLASTAAAGEPADIGAGDLRDDVISALVNLGYQRAAAEKAVQAELKRSPGAAFEDVLRAALRGLMR
jgi:Holliday junction DNA helicase RuvA